MRCMRGQSVGRNLLACMMAVSLSVYMAPLSSRAYANDEVAVQDGGSLSSEKLDDNEVLASDFEHNVEISSDNNSDDVESSDEAGVSGDSVSPETAPDDADEKAEGESGRPEPDVEVEDDLPTEDDLTRSYSNITDGDIAEVLSALEDEPQDAAKADGDAALRSISGSGAVKTFGGATMFETAVAEAKAAYSASDTVILAGPGDAWVDALASAGLAGALDCPILFTEKNSLHSATKKALQDLRAKNVVVVGGTAAIADSVVSELKGMGISLKARLGGADCFDTQMKIYNYGVEANLWSADMAIIATGGHYGDALSVSPIAYAKKAPIFLVENGKLRSPQKSALTTAFKNGEFSATIIVGGVAAVSSQTEGFLREMGACSRLGGATMYETSADIGAWAVKYQGFGWNNAAFTTGEAPYDALAGSVLQGKSKSVMLLVKDSSSAAIKTASANKGGINSIRFFGGTAAISPSLRTYIVNCVSDKITYEYTGVSLASMAKLEKVAASVFDPNQWGYEDGEFYQFAVLNGGYSGKVTAAQIDTFIAKNCVYSESSYGVTSKLRGSGQYFIDAAKAYGVNEVYLVSHAILESAWGCSTLAQGKVKGYEGYLNFYGIGAYDIDPYNGGAALAKSKKWTNPQKAINGAAEWIAKSSNRYLNNAYDQNTLYKMRWNYEQAAQEGAVWKQYATSPTWATGIANVMASFYSSVGMDKSDTGLKFLVPLY